MIVAVIVAIVFVGLGICSHLENINYQLGQIKEKLK